MCQDRTDNSFDSSTRDSNVRDSCDKDNNDVDSCNLESCDKTVVGGIRVKGTVQE